MRKEKLAKTNEEKILYLAKTRGFCAGVKNAIQTVEKLLDNSDEISYVRHEIVHNKHVIEELERKGVVFVEDIAVVPEGARLVFSAHGVSSSVEDEAKKKKLKITDATCPIVKKIHRLATLYSTKGFTMILIGHREHPEIIGTSGRIEGKYYIVENRRDVKKIIPEKSEKFVCLTQTTLSPEESEDIYLHLKKALGARLQPFNNNICYATRERQNAVKNLALKAQLIFVIGSRNSSNSRRLKEIAEKCGVKVFLIDDETAIRASSLKNIYRIGVTSGASAPERIVVAVLEKLRKMGWKKKINI